MKAKLVISFDKLNEPDFKTQMEKAATAVEGNPNLAPLLATWPAAVLTPIAFGTQVTAYGLLYKAAAEGDKIAIKARIGGRTSLSLSAQKLCGYLEIACNYDPAILGTMGFELHHEPVKAVVHDTLPAPDKLSVKRGTATTTAIVHAHSLEGATTYYLQTCVGDPGVAANWSASVEYEHCNRILVTGLALKLTYFRLCGWNQKSGFGLWATSAGLEIL